MKKRTQKRQDKVVNDSYRDHGRVKAMLQQAQDADHDMREAAREAALFVIKRNGQWEPYWWNLNSDKPRYTFDMTSPIIDQITGELDRAEFSVRVTPAGGDATKEVALTLDGMIRNIENISNADWIYDQAGHGVVTSGIDGWRVIQKYIDDNSFDQELALEYIDNFIDRCWIDPAAKLQDKSDARYGFILHPVAPDEYERRWPKGSKESVPDDREGEAYYDKAECIVVCEFLYGVVEQRELVLMSNGQVHEASEDFDQIVDELAAMGVTEVRRRTRDVTTFYSRYFDMGGWLEDEKETVFDRIPIVPVYGNYRVFENKSIYYGVVEKVIDPQRVMNYSLSREIEEGALAPRAKYWMTRKQAAGEESKLATLNTNTDPVQFFTPDERLPGPPQQNGGAQVNPGLRTISESMRQIIGHTGGMFASNMGDNPGLQSGVAIERQQDKGDNGTFKYFKSVEVAIQATGRLLVRAIPRVYDSARTARILFEDGTYEMADLNQTVIDEQTGDVITMNDLTSGTYDVVCDVGPAFQSRQRETIDMIIDVSKINPEFMTLGADILMNNINSPASKQLAERMRSRMLEQGLIPVDQMTEDEQAEAAQRAQAQGQQPDAAMVLAQAEQTKAQAELTNAQTNQRKIELEMAKVQVKQMELQAGIQTDSAELQIDGYDAATRRMVAETKAQEAGAKIGKDIAQTEGTMIDNAAKIGSIVAGT